VIVTASTDRQWVRALTSLRARGVAAAVVVLDASSYALADNPGAIDGAALERAQQEMGLLRFALAEYDINSHEVCARDDLGAVLA
jgi:hypothetical protein